MVNTQTSQVNDLILPIARAFSTNGQFKVNIYDKNESLTKEDRVFKATGPGAKYIPIDYLPKSRYNLDGNYRYIPTAMLDQTNLTIHGVKTVMSKLRLEKSATLNNAKWWKDVSAAMRSDKLKGWTNSDFESTARATYVEEDIEYATGTFNRENFMARVDRPSEIHDTRVSYNTPLSGIINNHSQSACRRMLNTNGNLIGYISSSLIAKNDGYRSILESSLAFGVMLNAEYFQEWLLAYESQTYLFTPNKNLTFKDSLVERNYDYTACIKKVTFDPKWFTVVFNEAIWKEIYAEDSNMSCFKEYYDNIILVALNAGMGLDTNRMLISDISCPIATDIKQYLTKGLSNYAEESREFLTKVSRIKQG